MSVSDICFAALGKRLNVISLECSQLRATCLAPETGNDCQRPPLLSVEKSLPIHGVDYAAARLAYLYSANLTGSPRLRMVL